MLCSIVVTIDFDSLVATGTIEFQSALPGSLIIHKTIKKEVSIGRSVQAPEVLISVEYASSKKSISTS